MEEKVKAIIVDKLGVDEADVVETASFTQESKYHVSRSC